MKKKIVSSTDLIIEMHGMLSSLTQKLEDHIVVDDKSHIKLNEVEQRLIPVENFHGSMKTAGKILAMVGTPAAGAGLIAWFKTIFSHTKGV